MSKVPRQVVAGRVGRAHGLDGGFYLDAPAEVLEPGTVVLVGLRELVVERVEGSAARPLLRLGEIRDRADAVALFGAPLIVRRTQADLDVDEYFSADLVGCEVEGLGRVRRVISAPSCDLLEVGVDGRLVPFVRDAVTRVDAAAGVIEVDRRFLGLDEP